MKNHAALSVQQELTDVNNRKLILIWQRVRLCRRVINFNLVTSPAKQASYQKKYYIEKETYYGL